jgi:hypothetical protein
MVSEVFRNSDREYRRGKVTRVPFQKAEDRKLPCPICGAP